MCEDSLVNIYALRSFVGLVGPGRDLLQGPALIAHVLGVQQRGPPIQAAGPDLRRRAQAPGDHEGRLVVEDAADGGGEAGEQGVELAMDLVAEVGVLPHQVAAVAGQEPELGVGRIEHRVDQAEAIDGGPLDGAEVGVVGLVLGIGGEAELLGGQGMDDAGLEAGGGGGALDRQVIVAGPLDGDDEIAKIMVRHALADSGHEVVESLAGMLDDGGLNEDVSREISEHRFGAGLGTVDGDDAEVLGPDLLDPGMDGSRGLGDRGGAPAPAPSRSGRDGHTDTSGVGRKDIPKPAG
jgi:hypothetical protein